MGSKEDADNGYYRILIERSQEEIAAKLAELKASIEKGDLKPWEFQGMKAIWFGRHLYEPLLYIDHKIVEISPVPLNKGERRFVEDLKTFHGNTAVTSQARNCIFYAISAKDVAWDSSKQVTSIPIL